MQKDINRRKLLSATAGTVAATGIAGKATASHDEFCQADWEDGDENDYTEIPTDDSIYGVGTSNNGYARLCSEIHVRDVFKGEADNFVYHVGIGGYAQSNPNDREQTCDYSFIETHGFSFEISGASMYIPNASNEILVAPDAMSSTGSSSMSNVPFSILSDTIGLVHPALGAASIAADAVATGMHALGNTDDNGDNYVEYLWNDNNPSSNDFSAVAHYVDFWIESDPDKYVVPEIFHAEIQHVASSSRCTHSVSSCVDSLSHSFASLSSSFEIRGHDEEGSIVLSQEEVSEEELRDQNMPEELLEKGPYHKVTSDPHINHR